jgi:thiosulfate/3-mercaptopyruvate sulfurtransferase
MFLCCVFMLFSSMGGMIPAGYSGLLSGTAWASETEAAHLRLISASAAKELLPEVVILDARPRSVWAQEHLPGACSFSWEDYTRTDPHGVKYRTLPPQELAQALGRMGMDAATDVLIYADADTSWGGEGWAAWVLAWLGHTGTVYILDGGIQAWQEAKFELVSGSADCSAPSESGTYVINLREELNISARTLREHKDSYTIVDTRNYWNEWLLGHVPDAVHINWEDFYTGENPRPLGAQALKTLLKQNGADIEKPVVYYCTGGIRSGYTWLVHTLAGLPAAINFEGGTEEWNALTP